MASRVPPAVTTTLRPASVPAASPAKARRTAAMSASGLAMRPAPSSPQARSPTPVGSTSTPAPGERLQVGLRGLVLVHRPVGRGRDDHRPAKREVDGREQVVGEAGGELGHGVGRGRRDDHDVGPPRGFDVLEPAPVGCHELSSSSTPARATAAKVSGMTKRLAASVTTTVGAKPSLLSRRTNSTAL